MTSTQRVVLVSRSGFAEDGPRPQVLMAYEDLNMALRAMNVLALVAREAGDILSIQFSMWRFAFFKSPALREASARQAAQADIVVVAPGNSGGGLLPPVTSWLDEWTGRRQPRPGALVAVFDPANEPGDASAVIRQLQTAAKSVGMDFFCSALQQFDALSSQREEALGQWSQSAFPTGFGFSRPLPEHIVE